MAEIYTIIPRSNVLCGGRAMASNQDQRLKPTYSIEEASGIIRIPIKTLSAWAVGRRKADGSGLYPPVLSFVDQELRRLSFFDLVEAHILRAAVEQDVPLQHIKRGLVFLRKIHPNNHRPLLTYDFKTEGKFLLVGGMLGSKEKDKEALMNASSYGQLVMTPVVEPNLRLLRGFEEYLELIGRDRSRQRLPDTLFPRDGQRIVSITSGIVSGRPVIEGTRIPTSIVAQRFNAGEDLRALAKDYRVAKEKIEAAIKFEAAA